MQVGCAIGRGNALEAARASYRNTRGRPKRAAARCFGRERNSGLDWRLELELEIQIESKSESESEPRDEARGEERNELEPRAQLAQEATGSEATSVEEVDERREEVAVEMRRKRKWKWKWK